MKITVLHNQSFLDIAVQHTGNVLNAFHIALVNEMSVSDSLSPGMQLILPDDLEINSDEFQYYRSNGYQPATAFKESELIEDGRGIGWMKIENSFKVG